MTDPTPQFPTLNGKRTMRVEFSFVVPGEPVPKARARVSIRAGKVRTHTPARTQNYEATVRLCGAAARPSGWPMRARYAVEITARRGAARSDLDNIVKAATDALHTVAWQNDSRVYAITARMEDGCEKPGLEVRIVAIPVRCKLKSCGGAETFYPDDEGRCETCAARARRNR